MSINFHFISLQTHYTDLSLIVRQLYLSRKGEENKERAYTLTKPTVNIFINADLYRQTSLLNALKINWIRRYKLFDLLPNRFSSRKCILISVGMHFKGFSPKCNLQMVFVNRHLLLTLNTIFCRKKAIFPNKKYTLSLKSNIVVNCNYCRYGYHYWQLFMKNVVLD